VAILLLSARSKLLPLAVRHGPTRRTTVIWKGNGVARSMPGLQVVSDGLSWETFLAVAAPALGSVGEGVFG